MKALIATGQREAAVAWADISMPGPQPGEVPVKVAAFPVNRGEIFLLEDSRVGARPGKDIAGVVVQSAAHGDGPVAGQRVVGHPEVGGWADFDMPCGEDLAILVHLVTTGCLHPEIGRVADWSGTAATLTDLYQRRILTIS